MPPPTLETFPVEVLGNIFSYLRPRERVSCMRTCSKFYNTIQHYHRTMQKAKMHKLYIEQTSSSSLLIKVQRNKENDYCLFEMETDDPGDICIRTNKGDENGMFKSSYRGTVHARTIQFYTSNSKDLLARCLNPILKWTHFQEIELYDAHYQTVIRLTRLLSKHRCRTKKLVVFHHKDKMSNFRRPTNEELIKLLNASGT